MDKFNSDGFLTYDRPEEWHQVMDVAGVVAGFLEAQDLRVCACVSTRFQELCDDDALWEHLLVMEFHIRSAPGKPLKVMGKERKFHGAVSAKALYQEKWKQPRSAVLSLLTQLKNFRSVDEYYRLQERVERQATDKVKGDVRPFLAKAVLESEYHAMRLNIKNQLKYSAQLGGVLSVAYLVIAGLPSGDSISDLASSAVELPSAVTESRYLLPGIVISGALGLVARFLRRKKNAKVKETKKSDNRDERETSASLGAAVNDARAFGGGGTEQEPTALPPLRASQKKQIRLALFERIKRHLAVFASLACRCFNDGLTSHVSIPLMLLGLLRVVDFTSGSLSFIIQGILVLILVALTGAAFFWIRATKRGRKATTPEKVIALIPALMLYAICAKVRFVYPVLATGLGGSGLYVLALVFAKMTKKRANRGGRYVQAVQERRRIICTCLTVLYGAIRALSPAASYFLISSWGYLGTFQFVQATDVASIVASGTPPLSAWAQKQDVVTIQGWLGLLATANVIIRWGAVRFTSQMFATRFQIHPLSAILFDGLAARLSVEEGVPVAIAVRILCAMTYVVACG